MKSNNSETKDSHVSKNPKANITLEKDLIKEVKDFVELKKDEDPAYPFRTPTALIREATRQYINPKSTPVVENQESIREIQEKLKKIEKQRIKTAEIEQQIFLKATAAIIDLFDKDHDIYEILRINAERLGESHIDPIEFRGFSRVEVEEFFMDNIKNPPEEYKELLFTNSLLQLLLMYTFLCNLGFTRKWDIIDPLAPMSMRFLDLLKEMIKNLPE